ncbi:thiamine pyrophosphate-binding protein [Candidatus Omnitrophota bacterium]
MVKVSDYVIDFLASVGIKDIFMVSGGAAMHLVDSVGRKKSIKYYCNYNEQATSYSAEGYSRVNDSMGACLVTSGPGGTNAISGVASCWVDSVPIIVISGQVKRELIADYSKLRQIGEQEINIIDMVKPITKYAVTIKDPNKIRYHLEKAVFLAKNKRPGPVWINIPLDVQGSRVDKKRLLPFPKPKPSKDKTLKNKVVRALDLLNRAKRPVILLGNGIKISKSNDLISKLLKCVKVPVLLSFNGMDILPENHPLYIGKPGIIGQRRANFCIQNADCVMSIGSRLNLKIIGYDYKAFAKQAKLIVVDIDSEELKKRTISPDLAINANAKCFLLELLSQAKKKPLVADEKWLTACRYWKRHYIPLEKEAHRDKRHVNTYAFFDKLSDLLSGRDIVVTGNGLAALSLYQAFKVKRGQRVFTNNGYGAMGWGLPASIGASIAKGKNRVICVTGDGSIAMNVQELELIRHHKLPVKIFVLNNSGYSSIRHTQDSFFKGFHVGSDDKSGVGSLDFNKIAKVFDLKYIYIGRNIQLNKNIQAVLGSVGPVLCEVNIARKQGVSPKTTSYVGKDGKIKSRALEDMYPFLPRQELLKNMEISRG